MNFVWPHTFWKILIVCVSIRNVASNKPPSHPGNQREKGQWPCVLRAWVPFPLRNHKTSHERSLQNDFLKNSNQRICSLNWQRGKGGKKWGRDKERERNINMREKHPSVASYTCPDQGWNPQPLGVWNNAPTNRATWPELQWFFKSQTHVRLITNTFHRFGLPVIQSTLYYVHRFTFQFNSLQLSTESYQDSSQMLWIR